MSALILVADADPFDLRLLSELCSTLGYDVVTAADGGAVLDAVARERPDLVLMDVALPVMDGLQVLRILKADQDLAQVPVVLVTAQRRRRGAAARRRDGRRRLRHQAVPQLRDPAAPAQRAAPARGARRRLGRAGAGRAPGHRRSADRRRHHQPAAHQPRLRVHARGALQPSAELRGRALRELRADRHRASAAARRRACWSSSPARCAVASAASTICFAPSADEFTILLPETDARGCRIVVDRLEATTARDELFDADVRPRPSIAVASACYPSRKVDDGEALWRGVAESCGIKAEGLLALHARPERASASLSACQARSRICARLAGVVMPFVYFIVMVGVLVFVHELGHFLWAKLFGVRVLRFSLGFGPRIAGFHRGGTEYVISALPLGGYVRMLGENPRDEVAHARPRRLVRAQVDLRGAS